jgi:hypothetical protein
MDAFGIGIAKPAGGTTGPTNELSEILGRTVIDKTGRIYHPERLVRGGRDGDSRSKPRNCPQRNFVFA